MKNVPVLFFLFLYTISLHGAATVETISMDLYKSEQLKSAFTEQTTNFRFLQEQNSVVDEAFIK